MEDQTTSQPITSPDTTTQPSEISTTDSTAQSGPAVGHDCTNDRPAPINTGSTGTITHLADIETYISKPADYPSTPAKLLLLLTGGTGIHSVNNQLQADRFAAAGYLVIMPDQFAGDIAPNTTNRMTSPASTTTTFDTEAQQAPTSSLLDRIKLGLADTAKSFVLDMWLARQTPEKVLPRLLTVIAAARDEYADALAHGDGLYAAGYCFGARYVLILAGDDPAAHPSIAPGTGLASGLPSLPSLPAIPGLSGVGGGAKPTADAEEAQPAMTQQPEPAAASTTAAPSGPLIKAGAIAHGTLVTREDVRGVTSVPMCVVAVADDPLFPEEVLEVGRKAWAANGAVECKVEVFEGVPHGFAVVGEYDDRAIMESQERAFGLMKGWLDGH